MELSYEVAFVGGKVGRHTGVAPLRLAFGVQDPDDALEVAAHLERLIAQHVRRARLLASKLIDVDAEITGDAGSGFITVGGRPVAEFILQRKGQS